MILAQLPDKLPLPDGANQAVIWIAVACITALIGGMGIGARWLMGYLDRNIAQTERLSDLFTEEMKSSREAFQLESDSIRDAHQKQLEYLAAQNLAQQNRAFETFERHVEKLAAAIEYRNPKD